MGTVIGPASTTWDLEAPNSPRIEVDRAGSVATERFFSMDRAHVHDFLNGLSFGTDADPIYGDAKLNAASVEANSPSIRTVTLRYEEESFGIWIIGPEGTEEREADANAMLTPVEQAVTDSTQVEQVRAEGFDKVWEPQPVGRYRKVKGSFAWTEDNIKSGVGQIDNAPTVIETGGATPNKWLMTAHSVRQSGTNVQEEWEWQYAENGWNTDLYAVWGGEAS